MKDHFPIQYRMIESGNKGEIIKAFFIMLYKNKKERKETIHPARRNSSIIRDALDRLLYISRRNSLDFDSSDDWNELDI